MVKAIVGANWGDEGKGKITDVLADKSDIVIQVTPSSMTLESLRFISFRQAFSTRTL